MNNHRCQTCLDKFYGKLKVNIKRVKIQNSSLVIVDFKKKKLIKQSEILHRESDERETMNQNMKTTFKLVLFEIFRKVLKSYFEVIFHRI